MSFSEDGLPGTSEADCTIAAEGWIHQATTRAAAGHRWTQGGLSATGRSMRHRWPSRRGSESARLTCAARLPLTSEGRQRIKR